MTYSAARRGLRRATRRLGLYLTRTTYLWDVYGERACPVLFHEHVLTLARRIERFNKIVLYQSRRRRAASRNRKGVIE